MPITFTEEDFGEPKESSGITFSESDFEQPKPSTEEPIEKEFKRPPIGVAGAFVRGLTKPSAMAALGPSLLALPEETKKDLLLKEYNRTLKETEPSKAAKVSEFIGGIPGSMVPYAAGAMLGRGRPGMMAAGAAISGGEAFLNAGVKALSEGKDIDEALKIANAIGSVSAATGAGTAALFPTGPTTGIAGAAKTGGIVGTAAGASQFLQNLAERELGLQTKPTEGVLKSALMMGLLPPVAHGLGAGARYILPKVLPTRGGVTDAVQRQAEGVLQPVQEQPREGQGQVPIAAPEPEISGRSQPISPQEEAQVQRREVDDLTRKAGEPSEKAQGKEEAVRETVEPSGVAPTTPEFTLTPAVEAEGRVFTGKNHADAIVHASKQGVDALDAEHKFLGSDGKFYNRKEAGAIYEQNTGKKPKFEEGLHSTELEQAGMLEHVPEEPREQPTAKAPDTGSVGAEPEPSIRQPSAMAVGIAPPGTEAFQRFFEWTKTLPAKLAGKAAPVTSRASEESGNALVRFASSKIAAPQVAKSLATEVLGDKFKDSDFSRKLGAVLVEDRLRSIPNEQAGSIIGKDYSPFKTEAEYQAALKDPEIQAAIQRHKQTVQPQAQEMHEATGGELAGPGLQTGAFVNLKAIMPGAEEFFGGITRGNLENPLKRKTRFGKEAKGTAEEYELDYRTLAQRMIQGNFEEFSKRQLYDQLVRDGLAQVLPPGSKAPTIGGKPTVKFTIERRGGKVENLWIRKDLAQEFRNAENVEGPISSSGLINAANALNRIQLAGPTDAVWHVANMLGSIAGSQGGRNVLTDLARKIPGVNLADALGRITASGIKVMRDSPEIQAQLGEIAKIGAGRAEHGGGLGSRAIALVDKAGRLVRDDMYKNLVDRGLVEANEATRREWINQLGQYNPRLMGQFQRFFKEAGFSPFIVAGRNFNRMAARRLTLDPGIKAANPAAYWQMKGVEAMGIVATLIAVPTLINLATTGKPNGRPGTKFGQIDTGKDTSDGRHIVIDPAQWTGLRRGLRISGIGSVVEGIRKGEPSEKIARKAITDVLGGVIHPWAGPAINVATVAATGYSPTKFKESENPNDYGANVKAALKQLNPLAESLITAHEKDKGKAESALLPLAGAVGVKAVYPTTAQQLIGNKVQQWMKSSGDPKLVKQYEKRLTQDFGLSDYAPLRDALRANDQAKAKTELGKLLESKSRKQVGEAMLQSMNHPFTGSRVKEGKFRQSLSEEDRALYDKAKEERRAEYQKFLEVFRK